MTTELVELAAEMRNFADVADHCDITHIYNTTISLRAWADRLDELASRAGGPEVRFNPDGSLDEIVGDCSFHLEQMSPTHWWIQVGPHMVNLHAKGKITAHFGKNEAAPEPVAVGSSISTNDEESV